MGFLKGLAFLTPTILAVIGVIFFSINDPIAIIIYKIIAEVFCGALAVLILFFLILIIVWGLKNALIHIFKIDVDLKIKK
jgi:hypothetical protein